MNRGDRQHGPQPFHFLKLQDIYESPNTNYYRGSEIIDLVLGEFMYFIFLMFEGAPLRSITSTPPLPIGNNVQLFYSNTMDMHFQLKNNMYTAISFIKALKSDGHLK